MFPFLVDCSIANFEDRNSLSFSVCFKRMRKIIHVDMDCFFAAVEVRDHPHLRGKPVAVGGSAKGRGVLSTANYEARKYGVRSALPTATALRLCPDLILMPHRFHVYKEESQKVREVFEEYTSIIQPLSLDEAFLDVTDCDQCQGSATLIAQEIRKKIFERTKLTASAGIAPNKFLAKIASDWRKPNGQFTIKPEEIDTFMIDLPVTKIFGVGKVTAAKLHGKGIKTCGDLQKYSPKELYDWMGKFGKQLYELSRGIDTREVKTSRTRKSFSVENTYGTDLPDLEACFEKLIPLMDELQTRLEKKEITSNDYKGIQIKIKFHDFQTTTVSEAGLELTLENAKRLIEKGYSREMKPVRLLGVGVQLIDKDPPEDPYQLSLL